MNITIILPCGRESFEAKAKHKFSDISKQFDLKLNTEYTYGDKIYAGNELIFDSGCSADDEFSAQSSSLFKDDADESHIKQLLCNESFDDLEHQLLNYTVSDTCGDELLLCLLYYLIRQNVAREKIVKLGKNF